MAPGDELGEDRDGDLLLPDRTEIEARRRLEPRQRILLHSHRAQRGGDGLGPLRTGDQTHVSGRAGERGRERLLVAAAHGRNDDRVGETTRFTYRPGHEWYWFPRQTPTEVSMLKCYDSVTDGSVSRWSFHTACVDPTVPLDAPCRKNVVVRSYVFF